MTDLDRLFELAEKARQEAESGVFDNRNLNAFIAACDPGTIGRLIERVREAEYHAAKMKNPDDWINESLLATERKLEATEARLRAAGEVVEAAKRIETHGVAQIRDALRHYDEAVGRVKE